MFVHYNRRAELSGHVLYTLEQIHRLFDTIFFISNSPLTGHQQELIRPFVRRIILRDNLGYDFCAWKDGMLEAGWSHLESYDSLTLMNDSCFGPLFDLEPYYQQMEEHGHSFWGLTRHRACRPRIGSKRYRIPSHLQSNFIVFRQPVMKSNVFKTFWEEVTPQQDIWGVILRYEIRLTGILTQAGFTCGDLFDSEREYTVNPNAAHYYPSLLIQRKIPFIKIRSLLLAQHPQEIVDHVRMHNSHLADLIEAHVTRQCRPDISLRTVNKTLPVSTTAVQVTPHSGRTAIHLDVQDPEYVQTWLDSLPQVAAIGQPCDIFITAPTFTDCAYIKNQINERRAGHRIPVCQPAQSAQHPWTQYAEQWPRYNWVGYFRIAQALSPDQPNRLVQHELLAPCLLGGMAQILEDMERHPEVGIVISDEPTCTGWPDRPQDGPNTFDQLTDWITQLQRRTLLQLDANDWVLTPYATCMWYRPTALEPLTRLLLSETWQRSINRSTETQRALALLPVYMAWAQGYDYRIAALSRRLQTNMFTQVVRHEGQQLLREYMMATYPWKIVKCLVPLVNRCKSFLRTPAKHNAPP